MSSFAVCVDFVMWGEVFEYLFDAGGRFFGEAGVLKVEKGRSVLREDVEDGLHV